jgi:hypothetical protein
MEIGACQPNQEETAAPKQRGRTILLGFLGFLLALGVLLLRAYHGISPVVYGEYGEDVPSVTAFCQKDDAFLLADESWQVLKLKLPKFDHLLTDDGNRPGQRPKRTYQGPRYEGGLSDHLPMLLKLKRNTK